MKRASIDLGTNTCLLLIAECDEKTGEVNQILADHASIVRLGQGVDKNRAFQKAAMERAIECLKKYKEYVKKWEIRAEDVVCVATSQARDATNSREFFSEIKKNLGFSFQIISGEQEAQATFLGSLLPGMDIEKSCVIDIGGGSTEFMIHSDRFSLDVGSVRFTERYLHSDPVTDDQFWACQEAIDTALTGLVAWRNQLPKDLTLVGVAGTATTLAAWQLEQKSFDRNKIDHFVLTRGDLHRQVEELKWRTLDERKSLTGIEPLRADVLLAGAMILWRSLEILNFPEVQISTRGLRFGVLRKL